MVQRDLDREERREIVHAMPSKALDMDGKRSGSQDVNK
jgi:hypothetical protein